MKKILLSLSLLMAAPCLATPHAPYKIDEAKKKKSYIDYIDKKVIIASAASLIALVVAFYARMYVKENFVVIPEGLTFDRKNVIDAEGYWNGYVIPEADRYLPVAPPKDGGYPSPQAHRNPWPGKEAFLEKLARIENSASYSRQSFFTRLIYLQYKGMAPSRLEANVNVGSGEFFDRLRGMRWPQGYANYYIGQFNVKPSEDFYRYVMAYPI